MQRQQGQLSHLGVSSKVAHKCKITSVGRDQTGHVKSIRGLIYKPHPDSPSVRSSRYQYSIRDFESAIKRLESGERLPAHLLHNKEAAPVGSVRRISWSKKHPGWLKASIDINPRPEGDGKEWDFLQKSLKEGRIECLSIGMEVITDASDRVCGRELKEVSFVSDPGIGGSTIYNMNFSRHNEKKTSLVRTLAPRMAEEAPQQQQQQIDPVQQLLLTRLGTSDPKEIAAKLELMERNSKNFESIHKESAKSFKSKADNIAKYIPEDYQPGFRKFVSLYNDPASAEEMKVVSATFEATERVAKELEDAKAKHAKEVEDMKAQLAALHAEKEAAAKAAAEGDQQAKKQIEEEKARQEMQSKRPAYVQSAKPANSVLGAAPQAIAVGGGTSSRIEYNNPIIAARARYWGIKNPEEIIAGHEAFGSTMSRGARLEKGSDIPYTDPDAIARRQFVRT